MASQRYRYIGETPVNVPDMNWGYDDKPVMPGDVSAPHEGAISSTVLVPVGSPEELEWLKAHPEFQPAKTTTGGKS
jgi:hypothetical protein